jgi:2-polyprenyl-3-methyl-5-hydroxy-6-metoxy-1,4-benzoquinol methylase
MTDNQRAYNSNADFWVQIIRGNRDRYRTELTNRAVLDAIGNANDLTVLDAGCAEGYMSRTLAENGAKVTGIGGLNRSKQIRPADSRIPEAEALETLRLVS